MSEASLQDLGTSISGKIQKEAFSQREIRSPGGKKQSRVVPVDLDSERRHRGAVGLDVEDAVKIEGVLRMKKETWCTSVSRRLVDSTKFITFTALLTIYALVGDDLRLIFTNQPVDPCFDAVVFGCFFIFAFEIVVSCLGKNDYTCGFFFWLDVIATFSMLLDVTFVADGSLFTGGGSEQDNASNLRGGRTAKVGAKFARVIRVLRLVRILKLYKAWSDAQRQKRIDKLREARRQRAQRREARQSRGSADAYPMPAPGSLPDDWEDDFLEESEVDSKKLDSKIGQKMSEMTIRKTICLILAMLIVLPLMVHEELNQNPFSAEYGADHVWKAFQDFSVAPGNATVARTKYEEALLQMVYYHNWFEGSDSADLYYAQLYWVGARGQDENVVVSQAASAEVRPESFHSWRAVQHDDALYSYGSMPAQVEEAVRSEWSQNCDDDASASERWFRRGFSVLAEEIDNSVSYRVPCPKDLRYQESVLFAPRALTQSEYDDAHLVFYFDLRKFVQEESRLGLWTTFFVLCLLLMGSVLFSHDSNNLVVHPLENMMQRVLTIRSNPMAAIKMSDDEFRAEERAKALESRRQREKIKSYLKDLLTLKLFQGQQDGQTIMETVILEKTIIKLGTLLVIGFGQAGCNIIAHNLHANEQTALVDAMIPGAQVECVIGVARVNNFSATTEVLQTNITTFVNHIAEIVHGVANEFHGAPNRNSGDSFLIVWRINDKEDAQERRRKAEMSVVAFATMLGALHSSPLLAEYHKHPGMILHLGEKSHVDLSFGLHAGWAIEGAVGTEFKIDASYVSPNVSLAQSMQRMALVYGVRVLLSQKVVELCGKDVASKCRHIDRVIIIGSQEPMDLYCVDLDYRSVKVKVQEPLDVVWGPRTRYKARQVLESCQETVLSGSFDLARVFETDKIMAQMRNRYHVEFFALFNMGYQNYSQGEWQVARTMLSQTVKMLALVDCPSDEGFVDGPSAELLRYMGEHEYEAPADWRGIREAVEV